MKKNHLLVLGILLILAVFSAACTGEKDTGNFPTGKFRLSSDEYSGFNFNEDGTWNAINFGEVIAQGKYKIEGDTYIEQTNDQGCAAPMTFKYSFDGTNLTFQLTDESASDTTCEPRKTGFDNTTYVIIK